MTFLRRCAVSPACLPAGRAFVFIFRYDKLGAKLTITAHAVIRSYWTVDRKHTFFLMELKCLSVMANRPVCAQARVLVLVLAWYSFFSLVACSLFCFYGLVRSG